MEIKGIIAKFIYKSDDSAFKIAEFIPEDIANGSRVILRGPIDQANLNMSVTINGDWVDDPKYGKQFGVKECLRNIPTSQVALTTWLEKQKGVGPKLAGTISKKFGEDLAKVIAEDWNKMSEVKRVSKDMCNKIHEAWIKDGLLRKVQLYLIQGGLPSTETYARQIINRFKENTLSKIMDNPYRLTEIPGIGFKTADNMARQLGWSVQRPERLDAAISYLLQDAVNDGHSFLHRGELMTKLQALASIEIDGKTQLLGESEANIAIDLIIKRKDIIQEKITINGQPNYLCYLPYYYDLEVEASNRIASLLSLPQIVPNAIDEVLTKVEVTLGFVLSPEQRLAVIEAIAHNCSVITGLPGTGKSSTVRALIETATTLGLKVMIAAPTGRAAKRLQEVTGYEAKTIHRTLQYVPKFDKFLHDKNNPLSCDMLVIDEASMLNLELMVAVLDAVPDTCSVVWIGDVNQLASIGAGMVLRDLIASKKVFTTILTKIFRQAEGSLIIQNAHRIFRGENLQFPDKGETGDTYLIPVPKIEGLNGREIDDIGFVKASLPGLYKRIKEKMGFDPIADVQVLMPMKIGPAGSIMFNEVIREIVNPNGERIEVSGQVFRMNDRVMQTSNNYDLDIYNGDIGFIRGVDPENKVLDVEFFERYVSYPFDKVSGLALSYATSVHKCIDPNTFVETSDGIIRAGNLGTKGIIATPNGPKTFDNKVEYQDSKVYDINTTHGYSISVSKDHGLQSWNGIDWSRKNAEDLVIGDWLRLKLGVTIECDKSINLPLAPLIDSRSIKYNLPIVLNEDSAEFFGLMVGDGTIYNGGFRLVKRHIEVVERFSNLCASLFNVEPKGISIPGTSGVEVSSRFLVEWLRSIGGMSPNNKFVPEIILKASSSIQKSFLRGLFEDGTVNLKNGKVDHIEWSTCYKDLADTVHFLLLRLGIVSTKVLIKNQWYLYLYNSNVLSFAKQIGFISELKSNRLTLDLSAVKEVRLTLPISKQEVYLVDTIMSLSEKRNALRRGYISTNVANRLSKSKLGEFLKERLQWHHVRIKSIDKRIGPTVCVEVPEGNRFLQNGFDGWNSQGSEFPVTILILLGQHFVMLDRNIIYTGNTRAKSLAIYLSSKSAIETAIRTQKVEKRNSLLALRIRQAMKDIK
jgi:exodeoxyribonuclease V alpha subunit